MREIPTIDHDELVTCLDVALSTRQVALIHGEPGIGKSAACEQAAVRHGLAHEVLNLNQLTPGDVYGLMFPDTERGLTVQYAPQFLPHGTAPGTLVNFDELGACPEPVRKPALELILERRIGQYRLREDDRMVATTNTGDDGVMVYQWQRDTADRVLHLHLRADVKVWIRNYAVPRRLDPRVVWYLERHPDDFVASAKQEEYEGATVVPTPRSWTKVSDLIKGCTDLDARLALVTGKLGASCAVRFVESLRTREQYVACEELLAVPRDARAQHLPKTEAGCYALACALPALALRDLETAVECVWTAGLLDSSEGRAELAALCMHGVRIRTVEAFGEEAWDAIVADPHAGATAQAHAGLDTTHDDALSDIFA